MNRLSATLTIMGLFIVGVVAPIVLAAPIIVRELAYFIDGFPLYLRQLQGLATDANRPWMSKIIGEGLGHAEQSIGELTTLATDWVEAFLRSVWSGGASVDLGLLALSSDPGRCLLSSIYDWNKNDRGAVDNWVPPAQSRHCSGSRPRGQRHDSAASCVGQGALCLILAVFYAVALSLAGLNHAIFIGIVAGLISFVPYLGSLTGLGSIDVRCRSRSSGRIGHHILIVPADLLRRPVSRGLRAFAHISSAGAST